MTQTVCYFQSEHEHLSLKPKHHIKSHVAHTYSPSIDEVGTGVSRKSWVMSPKKKCARIKKIHQLSACIYMYNYSHRDTKTQTYREKPKYFSRY